MLGLAVRCRSGPPVRRSAGRWSCLVRKRSAGVRWSWRDRSLEESGGNDMKRHEATRSDAGRGRKRVKEGGTGKTPETPETPETAGPAQAWNSS